MEKETNKNLIRYSKITKKYPREFILLQGRGCSWRKCTFCDYYNDVSENIFDVNKNVIDLITGEFGVLDVINSGSMIDLDSKTINLLINKIKQKNINTVWFECHWMYRNRLKNFSDMFKNVEVKYRTGAETFNTKIRLKWNKNIPEDVTPIEIAKYFKSINLLFGVKGQSFDDIINDINISEKYFEHYIINIFQENTKFELRDEDLIKKFVNEIYPLEINNPKCEILINNTDLGVG